MNKASREPRVPGNNSGFGAIKVVIGFFIAVIVIVMSIVVYYEGRKAYWDYRVQDMCEEDGGLKVNYIYKADLKEYENLKNNFGQIDIPRKGSDRSENSEVIHIFEDKYIRNSNPEVRRSKIIIINKLDDSIIATMTIYSRVGGDLVSFHPSYYSCPELKEDFYSSIVALDKE